MINLELFNILVKLPHIAGRIQIVPRRKILRTTTRYRFLHEGFAYEYYQTDKKRQLVSWFWIQPGFVIPTSPYSKIVFSGEAEFIEFSYSDMFRELRKEEEYRLDYLAEREVHNLLITDRISDILYLSPFENYLKLKEWVPAAFDYLSKEMIASYLNIEVIQLRRFMLRRRVSLQLGKR